MLGEPLGTLILTLAIVVIEDADQRRDARRGGSPTVGRDTMFAVMMIVLNGVLGLSLVVGGSAITRRSTASRGDRVSRGDHPAGHDRADPAERHAVDAGRDALDGAGDPVLARHRRSCTRSS
jgi:hypothetical protein